MPSTRSTLKTGLYELNGVLEDPLHVPVVVPELGRCPRLVTSRPSNVIEPGGRAGEPEDHAADGRLAAAALTDQRDDFARLHGEAHGGHGGHLGLSEHARLEDLRDVMELKHQALAFQQATERPCPESLRTGAPRRICRTRTGSAQGVGTPTVG